MEYRADELTEKVRVSLDMNDSDRGLMELSDPETLTLDDIIAQKIEYAARVVESNAPASLLDSGRALSGSISFKEEIGIGRGRMLLPDDFMRLITFKMSDWERAVTEPIYESDPLYRQMSSRFPGLRGTPQKPVVAIVNEPTGLVLEFWSCVGGSSVVLQRGRYLPIPRFRGGGIEICEKLVQQVVVYAAYLTALTVREKEQAELLLAQYNEIQLR